MRRFWRPALLAVALLCVQLVLAVHGIGHALEHEENEAVCIECLALANALGAPPAAVAALPAVPGTASLAVAVPPAPTFARRLPFLSRAPPFLQG
jgi:hypothetical protein